jgi:ketosteroid isomerase-like protein
MQCDSCDIKNVIYQYADYLDRGDLRRVAAMFSHGKIIALDAQGKETDVVGEEAVYAMYQAFTRLYEDNGSPHTKHMTSNIMVDVAPGGAVATAQAYAVVFQSVGDFPLQPIIGVRYYDTFEKTVRGWRFTERKIESDLFGDLSKHLLQPL